MSLSAQRQSPCIRVCQMDEETGFCSGCFRTPEEIAKWLRYSDDERDAVIAGLGKRRAEYFGNGGKPAFSFFSFDD